MDASDIDYYMNSVHPNSFPPHYLKGFVVLGLLSTDDTEVAGIRAREHLRYLYDYMTRTKMIALVH